MDNIERKYISSFYFGSSFYSGEGVTSDIEDYWYMIFDPYASIDPYFTSLKGLSFRLKAKIRINYV